MCTLKLGEYGRILYFNAGIDITDAISYSVLFIKPNCDEVTVVATLETEQKTGCDQDGNEVTFEANQYTSFIIPQDFIDQCGAWQYQAINPTSTGNVPGDIGTFIVDD